MKKFLQIIWNGDAGLAKTYWGYGTAGTAVFALPLAVVTPGSVFAIISVLIFLSYFIFISFSVWRAAEKYQGPKIWSLLPRAFILVTLVIFLIGTIASILIPANMKDKNLEFDGLKKSAVQAQITWAEARNKLPELNGLSDESALNVIHKVYYPDMDKSELARRLGLSIQPAIVVQRLGVFDQLRYEHCQKDATNAPTQYGVNVGLRLCREKFSQ